MTHLNAATWRWILLDYDDRHCCDEQLEWFRSQPSLQAAIDLAARAVDASGHRFSHQYRIRKTAIAQARAALLAAERPIARADSFDKLFDIVSRQLHDVAGVGELYEYDTSFRIGAYLGLLPERVYLHAGTRAGARILGLAHEKKVLEMSELPPQLRHRAPHEVEDILCIYKGTFLRSAIPADRCAPKRGSRRGIC